MKFLAYHSLEHLHFKAVIFNVKRGNALDARAVFQIHQLLP